MHIIDVRVDDTLTPVGVVNGITVQVDEFDIPHRCMKATVWGYENFKVIDRAYMDQTILSFWFAGIEGSAFIRKMEAAVPLGEPKDIKVVLDMRMHGPIPASTLPASSIPVLTRWTVRAFIWRHMGLWSKEVGDVDP